MSIEDSNKIDFLAVEQGHSKIVLAISDHWEWAKPLEHIYALQEKMNAYAAFVESGQVWDSATKQCGRSVVPGSVPVEVKVFLRFEPPPIFFQFLAQAREAFASLDVSVTHELRLG